MVWDAEEAEALPTKVKPPSGQMCSLEVRKVRVSLLSFLWGPMGLTRSGVTGRGLPDQEDLLGRVGWGRIGLGALAQGTAWENPEAEGARCLRNTAEVAVA